MLGRFVAVVLHTNFLQVFCNCCLAHVEEEALACFSVLFSPLSLSLSGLLPAHGFRGTSAPRTLDSGSPFMLES